MGSELKSKFILFLWPLLIWGTFVQANETINIPQIGPHQRIFVYEKNENPQNILVVYGKIDPKGQIQPASEGGLFDFYWLMDRQNYKPTNALIKSGIRERLQVVQTSTRSSFDILLADLKEVQTDIPDARLTIQAEKQSDGTQTGLGAYITLGPSDHNARIKLESIYAEAAKSWNPLSRKLISITLKGVDVKTGQTISRKYLARQT